MTVKPRGEGARAQLPQLHCRCTWSRSSKSPRRVRRARCTLTGRAGSVWRPRVCNRRCAARKSEGAPRRYLPGEEVAQLRPQPRRQRVHRDESGDKGNARPSHNACRLSQGTNARASVGESRGTRQSTRMSRCRSRRRQHLRRHVRSEHRLRRVYRIGVGGGG